MYCVEESLQNEFGEVKEQDAAAAVTATALGQPDACAQLGRGRHAEGADALRGLAFTELPLQGACRSQI